MLLGWVSVHETDDGSGRLRYGGFSVSVQSGEDGLGLLAHLGDIDAFMVWKIGPQPSGAFT